jgi:hypothetical protein
MISMLLLYTSSTKITYMATEQIVDPFLIMIAISGFFSVTVLVSSLLTIRKKKIKKEDILENNI